MKTVKTLAAAALVALVAPFAVTAHAQATDQPNKPQVKADSLVTADMTDGEVRKIDKDTQKITLKHGEIRNLGMPGMTMVFKVKDAALLDSVQVGGKVRFTAEKVDGAIVVTAISAVK